MSLTWRDAKAIGALPFTATVVVPGLLLLVPEAGPPRLRALPLVALGAVALAGGLVLVGWCVLLFRRRGEGTLAPWDPPRRLVVAGPYRYVRNPMISGAMSVLVGESLVCRSIYVPAWALLFWVFNTIYFVLSEEPGLTKRFGADYLAYRQSVPRWIPRRTPWEPGR